MQLKSIFLAILSLWFFSSFPQNFEQLKSDLLNKRGLTSKAFDQSLNNYASNKLILNDTVLRYREWLQTNRVSLLSGSSQFFRVHYYLEQARACRAMKDNKTALINIDSALLEFRPAEFPVASYNLLRLGTSVSTDIADYKNTIRYLDKVLDYNLFSNDSAILSRILVDMADYCLNFHQYQASMKYCNLALPILDQLGEFRSKVRVLLIMYNNSFHSADDPSFRDYLDQAAEIALSLKDSALLGNIYSTRGTDYYRAGDQLKAIDNYRIARSFIQNKETGSDLSTAIMQHLSYTLIDSVEAAGKLSEYIVGMAIKTNQPAYLRNGYRGRAWYYAMRNMKDSTTYYLDLADQYSELYGKPDAMPGFLYSMFEVCMIVNDYDRAIGYLNKTIEQYRIINRTENAENLGDIRAQFDYQLQKERIMKLKLENDLAKVKNARLLFLIIAIGVILAAVVCFMVIFRKQLIRQREAYQHLVKKNLELDELNTELAAAENMIQSRSDGMFIRDEDELYKKLKILFDQKKIYKNQDLSLQKLAQMLESNTTYISSIINGRFGMSFKTLLNKYRIGEARKLLVTDDFANYSVEGIAHEVGYQSRSTFYQEFRQNTGVTPKDYIEGYRRIGTARVKAETDDV